MQRYDFLKLFGLGSLYSFAPKNLYGENIISPPFLKQGDTIGLTSPAGYITLDDIKPAIDEMQSWGLKVKIGKTIGKKDFTYGGTDKERIEDLNEMIADKNIHAIMCARGGYGMVRIIDKINFTPLKKNPKWIIGFSDITTLHAHLNATLNLPTIHSKMCNSFPSNKAKMDDSQIVSISSIKDALFGKKINYTAKANIYNKVGTANGILIGGNLRTIENMTGSISSFDTKGKILILEDVGEYLYSIDRMFWNLKRSNKLDKLAGLIIGGFKIKKDTDTEDFGKILEEIVVEKTKDYNYPIAFDFAIGHQKFNLAYKFGIKYKFEVTKDNSKLIET